MKTLQPMNSRIILASLFIIVFSCKNDQSTNDSIELTTVEKIANANGIDQWENVNEIQFTFNVDRADSHFERSWKWNPKTDDVMMMTSKDTISYNRTALDSISINADKGFINDKFWLLAPFNLVWDEGTTITYEDSVKVNLSDKILNKVTTVYGSEGGYTPGDAYDFFYDENFMIHEWVFRKGNQEEPSMITTWEDYEDFNGIKIARTHMGKDNSVKLYFTNIKVE